MMDSVDDPSRLYIFVAASISSGESGGSRLGKTFASIDFPEPGGPERRRL